MATLIASAQQLGGASGMLLGLCAATFGLSHCRAGQAHPLAWAAGAAGAALLIRGEQGLPLALCSWAALSLLPQHPASAATAASAAALLGGAISLAGDQGLLGGPQQIGLLLAAMSALGASRQLSQAWFATSGLLVSAVLLLSWPTLNSPGPWLQVTAAAALTFACAWQSGEEEPGLAWLPCTLAAMAGGWLLR